MAQLDHTTTTTKAVNDAKTTWDRFLTISKYCGIAIAILLILMAVTLV